MPRARRIVFVGAGPRAVMLLERLLATLEESAPPLEITLVDPHPPGAGRIWRRDQSPLLKLNSMAQDVTVFTDETARSTARSAPARRSSSGPSSCATARCPTSTIDDPRVGRRAAIARAATAFRPGGCRATTSTGSGARPSRPLPRGRPCAGCAIPWREFGRTARGTPSISSIGDRRRRRPRRLRGGAQRASARRPDAQTLIAEAARAGLDLRASGLHRRRRPVGAGAWRGRHRPRHGAGRGRPRGAAGRGPRRPLRARAATVDAALRAVGPRAAAAHRLAPRGPLSLEGVVGDPG